MYFYHERVDPTAESWVGDSTKVSREVDNARGYASAALAKPREILRAPRAKANSRGNDAFFPREQNNANVRS